MLLGDTAELIEVAVFVRFARWDTAGIIQRGLCDLLLAENADGTRRTHGKIECKELLNRVGHTTSFRRLEYTRIKNLPLGEIFFAI